MTRPSLKFDNSSNFKNKKVIVTKEKNKTQKIAVKMNVLDKYVRIAWYLIFEYRTTDEITL